MKDFIGLFFACFFGIIILIFFFGGFIFENIWAMIIIVSFVLAMIMKGFMNQESRMEELEQKIQEFSDGKE